MCVCYAATTPWYDEYRNSYLSKLRSEDREPIHHYVSGNVSIYISTRLFTVVRVCMYVQCVCVNVYVLYNSILLLMLSIQHATHTRTYTNTRSVVGGVQQ